MTRRMLDVEYVEELLCVLLDGIQDKKKCIDEFCEKYAVFEEGVDNVRQKFMDVLKDIEMIFSEESGMDFAKTRFRQRSDLYSLFCVIVDLQKSKQVIAHEKLAALREELKELDKKIEPMSENEQYREYAIRCTSDANSQSSRKWRYDFLHSIIQKAYE